MLYIKKVTILVDNILYCLAIGHAGGVGGLYTSAEGGLRKDASSAIGGFDSGANDFFSGLEDQAVAGPVVRIDISDLQDGEALDESMFGLVIEFSLRDIEMLIDDLSIIDILAGGDRRCGEDSCECIDGS